MVIFCMSEGPYPADRARQGQGLQSVTLGVRTVETEVLEPYRRAGPFRCHIRLYLATRSILHERIFGDPHHAAH